MRDFRESLGLAQTLVLLALGRPRLHADVPPGLRTAQLQNWRVGHVLLVQLQIVPAMDNQGKTKAKQMSESTATGPAEITNAGVESDEQLMLRYRDDGDHRAIDVLIHRYERPLYNYLARYLGNRDLAEDAFQATFLRLHRKRHLYQAGRPLRPWLYRIATNVAIDLTRRRRAQPATSLDAVHKNNDSSDSSLSKILESPLPEPHVQLEKKEWREWTHQAVANLPGIYRIPLLLIYFQGLTYREASQAVDIPLGTVKSRLHKAIVKLNEAWRRDHPGAEI